MLLEVIALTPEDALAAEAGGADRLEIVRDINVGGLTPGLEQFQRIRDAVVLPLRVMLRTNGGFRISPAELDSLLQQALDLREQGVDQFVFGFLDDRNSLDLDALGAICAVIDPRPWTLHHAFDHAADAVAAWAAAGSLPHLDNVLSGGIHGDLRQGLSALCGRASWQRPGMRWLAGGGLMLDHVEPLRAAGITMFHIGRAARYDHSWGYPVSADAVRRWRRMLDASQPRTP